MAADPTAVNTSGGREIPTRRVKIKDSSQLPHDYSSTPGGTLFSTTPGGTRIIYDRDFLLHMRESPLARTPPKNLPNIPGVTTDVLTDTAKTTNGQPPKHNKFNNNSKDDAIIEAEDPQFEMDI